MADYSDQYWIVGGSTTEVYSTKVGDYVPVDDMSYQLWSELAYNRTSNWDGSEHDFGEYLGYGCAPRPVNAAILEGYKDGQAEMLSASEPIPKVLHWLTNEIRALQGETGTLTFEEWQALMKDLM